jgi:hypothetical protein
MFMAKINVQQTDVTILRINNNDYVSLTDIARFKMEAGLNAFTLSPQKWIDATDAKGMISKSGRYGGTFAHK